MTHTAFSTKKRKKNYGTIEINQSKNDISRNLNDVICNAKVVCSI